MRVVAFVPAKGNSERVVSKNARLVGGEPLYIRKLKQLLASQIVTEVWLDTDSDEFIQRASSLPVNILRRDPRLATNGTDGHEMFMNEVSHVPGADIVVQALCTAPFLGTETMDSALRELIEAPGSDSLVAVRREKLYTWSGGAPDYGEGRIPNSSDLPFTTIEAMSFYAVRGAGNIARRFGSQPILFDIDPLEMLDINQPADLALAQQIETGRAAEEHLYFRVLKSQLSSALISDCCADLGFEVMLPDRLSCPMGEVSVLGRAKTLEIGPVADRDKPVRERSREWEGIYGALSSYASVQLGDVIVVSTAVPERAYFGDLNARLALRSGAVGVVVNGRTRDSSAVARMGLPVYSKGVWAKDVKYEGTLKSMNAPIELDGVSVCNGDVVFADHEGVAVITASKWPAVLESALSSAVKESGIAEAIIAGVPPSDIVAEFGHF